MSKPNFVKYAVSSYGFLFVLIRQAAVSISGLLFSVGLGDMVVYYGAQILGKTLKSLSVKITF